MVITSSLSAAEQYMLELVNAARLDPAAELLRMKVKLNAGLALNTLDATVKQVLAPNQMLEQAATSHAQWMLTNGSLSHTGLNGSTAAGRATDAGYLDAFLGESNNMTALTSPATLAKMIAKQVDTMFKSALDRANLLSNAANEIGVAQEQGTFGQGSNQTSMISTSIGDGVAKYVTGVAYNDLNKDGKYSIGEGVGGVTFMNAGQSNDVVATTGAAGGYAYLDNGNFHGTNNIFAEFGHGPNSGFGLNSGTSVVGTAGGLNFGATVYGDGNVKLDVVNGNTLASASSIELADHWFNGALQSETVVYASASTINNVRLLGAAAIDADGNVMANTIDGNKSANTLSGWEGNDTINGNARADTLLGGNGDDSMNGGSGNDSLSGDNGADNLNGWFGADRVAGGDGADVLRGGLDKDTFIFNIGDDADMIMDFSVRGKEQLELDADLWADAQGAPVALTGAQVVSTYATVVSGNVVFDFGDGDVLTLAGVKSLTGLAALIDII